jgi:hypothetical protein
MTPCSEHELPFFQPTKRGEVPCLIVRNQQVALLAQPKRVTRRPPLRRITPTVATHEENFPAHGKNLARQILWPAFEMEGVEFFADHLPLGNTNR